MRFLHFVSQELLAHELVERLIKECLKSRQKIFVDRAVSLVEKVSVDR